MHKKSNTSHILLTGALCEANPINVSSVTYTSRVPVMCGETKEQMLYEKQNPIQIYSKPIMKKPHYTSIQIHLSLEGIRFVDEEQKI